MSPSVVHSSQDLTASQPLCSHRGCRFCGMASGTLYRRVVNLSAGLLPCIAALDASRATCLLCGPTQVVLLITRCLYWVCPSSSRCFHQGPLRRETAITAPLPAFLGTRVRLSRLFATQDGPIRRFQTSKIELE